MCVLDAVQRHPGNSERIQRNGRLRRASERQAKGKRKLNTQSAYNFVFSVLFGCITTENCGDTLGPFSGSLPVHHQWSVSTADSVVAKIRGPLLGAYC